MGILPAQEIRRLGIITPFCERTTFYGTMTFGLGPAGYDIRLDQPLQIWEGRFALASSREHFDMPNDVMAQVCDKSSLARHGLFVQNTVIEPGWRGYLTLELTAHAGDISLSAGCPIAQIVFMRLESPTDQPYDGKYQDQERGPVAARSEP